MSTAKKSDLGVRTLSAIVMLAVAGGALWAGGWWWTAFVAIIGIGVLWEWARLAFAISSSPLGRFGWLAVGVIYVGVASIVLAGLGNAEMSGVTPGDAVFFVLILLAVVVATDTGAYFAGRAIGGPKIAPSISPSKTWAGLCGGALAAGAVLAGIYLWWITDMPQVLKTDVRAVAMSAFGIGVFLAVVAQLGDFFESWMKRKAGVKDSGNLIPGHGGLFDRVDGLLAVLFILPIYVLLSQ